jgi:hypothetical protein
LAPGTTDSVKYKDNRLTKKAAARIGPLSLKLPVPEANTADISPLRFIPVRVRSVARRDATGAAWYRRYGVLRI